MMTFASTATRRTRALPEADMAHHPWFTSGLDWHTGLDVSVSEIHAHQDLPPAQALLANLTTLSFRGVEICSVSELPRTKILRG